MTRQEILGALASAPPAVAASVTVLLDIPTTDRYQRAHEVDQLVARELALGLDGADRDRLEEVAAAEVDRRNPIASTTARGELIHELAARTLRARFGLPCFLDRLLAEAACEAP